MLAFTFFTKLNTGAGSIQTKLNVTEIHGRKLPFIDPCPCLLLSTLSVDILRFCNEMKAENIAKCYNNQNGGHLGIGTLVFKMAFPPGLLVVSYGDSWIASRAFC